MPCVRARTHPPPPREKFYKQHPPPRIIHFTVTFSNHPFSTGLLEPWGFVCGHLHLPQTQGGNEATVMPLLLSLLLMPLHACASFACCLGAIARVYVYAYVCTCVCAPVHVCVCVCARECVHVVRLRISAAAGEHACIPVSFISCITT